ncbi:MAG: hypothetical protein CBC49_005070 [Alphaproteobacteria bacterium TMED89]|nr:MAG: hypothetical protein CBC49_005070 [Alphaproteobacteria bacterium TMED89]
MRCNAARTIISSHGHPWYPQPCPRSDPAFTVSHLKNGSPATVSRAGVLFLNEADVGWQPYVQSWVDELNQVQDHIDTKETAWLEALVNQYIPPTIDNIRKNKWKHITPLMDFAMVSTLCSILEGLLTKKNCPPGSDKDVYEAYFQYAAVWAFGGCFGADKANDFRKMFSEWWRAEWGKTSFKFPDEGLVFDYYVELKSDGSGKVEGKHWKERVPSYTHATGEGASFSDIVVPTMDTTRLSFLINMLMPRQKPVMLVGAAGSAKTTIFQDNLSQLPDELMFFAISFNSFTNAGSLQPILEQPLEKKTGTMFAPPGTKKLIYFIDDVNMPSPDKYGTQSAIALLRQQIDYGGFYDLKKLTMKEIRGVQYLGAMNPTAGSFFIIDRMQRHFATFATLFPENDVLYTIYYKILAGHFASGSFADSINKVVGDKNQLANKIIGAALMLHKLVADAFLPTAVKFHYAWNLRELSRITQGMLMSSPDNYHEPFTIIRLWLHESYRVYGDRLTDEQDAGRFNEMVLRCSKNFFEDENQDDLHQKPLAFTKFAKWSPGMDADEELPYFQVADGKKLSLILTKKLEEYNESNARMDLVLFEQARQALLPCAS